MLVKEWVMQTFSKNSGFLVNGEEQFKSCNILLLELFPIVIALYLFGNELSGKCIVLHTDNKALVHVLNNQSSKCTQTMNLVRKLLLMNINIRAEHIPGCKNITADCLSRLKVEDARRATPGLNKNPLAIPHKLQPCYLLRPL